MFRLSDDERRARFWARVEKTEGCWLWKGKIKSNGYGQLMIGTKWKHAHRVAYEFARGPIRKGACVCHRCDVKNCVNPDHLFLGSHTDNMRDASAKGRMHPGEKNGMSKLRVEAARFIVENAHIGAIGLASKFDVHPSTVRDILKRRTWRFLQEGR